MRAALDALILALCLATLGSFYLRAALYRPAFKPKATPTASHAFPPLVGTPTARAETRGEEREGEEGTEGGGRAGQRSPSSSSDPRADASSPQSTLSLREERVRPPHPLHPSPSPRRHEAPWHVPPGCTDAWASRFPHELLSPKAHSCAWDRLRGLCAERMLECNATCAGAPLPTPPGGDSHGLLPPSPALACMPQTLASRTLMLMLTLTSRSPWPSPSPDPHPLPHAHTHTQRTRTRNLSHAC